MHPLIEQALGGAGRLDHGDLVELLTHADAHELYEAAYGLKCRLLGKQVALRGLIEFSNICQKNCFYCGIRRGNGAVHRYRMSADEIVEQARWAYEHQYGSIALQSGELETEANTAFVEEVLRRIHAFAGEDLGITICLGEQTEEVYRRWLAAGAHRYLLRIETSVPDLYRRLHPADHSFERRRDCLRTLKRLGYQLGSGVMIGLPGQTIDDLASDLEFYRAEGLDMIGMGPYLPHHQTPLGQGIEFTAEYRARQLELGLRMIAVCRLYLHDVNIAATTALQALDDRGREQGILAGANVIMPNVTDRQYRGDYLLYENKPCVGEGSLQCRGCLEGRIQSIGESIAWGRRNDPLHYGRQ